ncbi:hypothetical protein JOC85_003057 [Bacillus mesophilus]|uniref:DUF4440 domain-containing protein n=1 Tax=Bacillus mesophilus TaxID=1808955 RepID=A0A6M0Q9S0_9BACI|nr:hypothetical protein [Bacillus mesophilus]NEY73111.1 DUF4440 domain-containing protein [Bacillus mesophilus]
MTYKYSEFNELLADDFLEFGTSGNIYNKQVELDSVKNGSKVNLVKFTVTDFNIRELSPDVILATYKTLRHTDNISSLRSSIWKLKEDNWKMVFHQATPTR